MIIIYRFYRESAEVKVAQEGDRCGAMFALIPWGSAVARCGREASEKKSGEGSASEGESASGGGSGSRGHGAVSAGEFQGVVAPCEPVHEEIDEAGGEQEVGEYRAGYIVEPPESWWEGSPEPLAWRGPAATGETNHREILPFEAETGLLIPDMEGTLTGLGEPGEEVDSNPLVFFRGGFYHYANNFSFPGSGTYILRAELEPPLFWRHETEEKQGRVYAEPVTVEFENVEISAEEE